MKSPKGGIKFGLSDSKFKLYTERHKVLRIAL
jgi:hypothetical protein